MNKILEFIKSAIDIDLLIKDLDIRTTGKIISDNIQSYCPFHKLGKERRPSFGIHMEDGTYNCFTCGGGNLVDLIKKIKNLERDKDVLEYLKNKYEISIDIEDDIMLEIKRKNAINIISEKLNIINKEKNICIPLDNLLLEKYRKRHPFLYERGIKENICKYFELGYTDNWIIQNGEKVRYTKRITIPVRNDNDELVGIIGRDVTNKDPVKYANSYGLKKNEILYNLNKVKKYSNKHGIILTEGPFDVFKITQAGFPNVVATMGSVLSKNQIRLLEKYTEKVYLFFDNDNSGYKARDQVIEDMKNICDIYIVPYDSKDPGNMKEEDIKISIEKAKDIFEIIINKEKRNLLC